PITVREMDGKYQIIAGERRFRALKLNGAVDVPVLIMDANEVQMAEMALVENIQRENLSAIEEAKSYVEIMKYSG
ncbi:ParB/RepB/Spo0J family partition protein, partial [Erysipelatoclostridium ramosum]